MEFVEGETLAQRVRSGNRLEIEEVLQLGVALAGGLAEAHAYGLVHRDLSSSNVIIPVRGTPKILDFGLAARVEGGAEGTKNPGLPETVKSILGTPGFIAPERMEGVTSDRRSDLYGLGAVLFFALTGQRPVADETPVGDKDGRRSAGRGRTLMHLDVQRLRPDGPPSLAAFIEELLSPDPWDRVQSAESAERELKAIERARLPARSSSGVANPVRPQGRSIWRAVGATFLFSMALAASMAWLQGCTGEVWKHRTHLDIATTEIDEVASIGVHCLACNGANLNQGR